MAAKNTISGAEAFGSTKVDIAGDTEVGLLLDGAAASAGDVLVQILDDVIVNLASIVAATTPSDVQIKVSQRTKVTAAKGDKLNYSVKRYVVEIHDRIDGAIVQTDA